MEEKRRFKRLPVELSLNISKLFKQNSDIISDINAPIKVVNISKAGIGFESAAGLPIGYYFNAKIDLGSTDSCLYTVIQIIRKEEKEGYTYYGCQFIGLAPILDFIFDEFEKSIEE